MAVPIFIYFYQKIYIARFDTYSYSYSTSHSLPSGTSKNETFFKVKVTKLICFIIPNRLLRKFLMKTDLYQTRVVHLKMEQFLGFWALSQQEEIGVIQERLGVAKMRRVSLRTQSRATSLVGVSFCPHLLAGHNYPSTYTSTVECQLPRLLFICHSHSNLFQETKVVLDRK